MSIFSNIILKVLYAKIITFFDPLVEKIDLNGDELLNYLTKPNLILGIKLCENN